MSEKELRNLQLYIGKRMPNQTDEQVIAHINKINTKTPLTQDEWHNLIFTICNSGYFKILEFVLSHIENLNNIEEYMKHTVYGRNEELDEDRIEVLKIFIKYLSFDKEKCLSEIMISAGWFGETKIVKFLIENGADKEYITQNGLGLLECSERAEKLFNDISLKEYLKHL